MKTKIYVISSVIVWVAILLAAAMILQGTAYFSKLLPILGGGATWFAVIAPAGLRKKQ